MGTIYCTMKTAYLELDPTRLEGMNKLQKDGLFSHAIYITAPLSLLQLMCAAQ